MSAPLFVSSSSPSGVNSHMSMFVLLMVSHMSLRFCSLFFIPFSSYSWLSHFSCLIYKFTTSFFYLLIFDVNPSTIFLFQLLCISAWEFLKFRISYVIFLISFSYLPMFLFSHLNIKTFTLNIFFRDRFCGNEFPQNCFVPFNESSHFLFFVKCNFVFLFLLLLKTEYLNLKI